MVAIFVDEKASVLFSLIPSLSTFIGIHKLLLLLRRRRRHRLFVFSFGPRCQLTAILDDGRPLCLLDAALRPPAAKHSHNSRLAASSSSNHSPRFSRWKDTFSSLPSIRFSRCGNMQIPRIRVFTPNSVTPSKTRTQTASPPYPQHSTSGFTFTAALACL
ncbi:hypothetical protein CSPX01_11175 [Colletotrichum filicis]|nr:hypothetical protein CSPX01_11175 [Colletotrichum filicis]